MKKVISEDKLSTILSLFENCSVDQKSAIKSLLNMILTPYELELFKKSKDPKINKYIQKRFKQIYKIKGTFEDTFAQKIGLPIEDIEELGPVDLKEYEIMKKELLKARSGNQECFDFTEIFSFLSYHSSLGLTSSIDYIRTLTGFIIANG